MWSWKARRKPAHSLIDLCQNIYETGNIVWIHPSKCKKRETEIKYSRKEPKQILKVEQQVVRVDIEVESADAEHGTETQTHVVPAAQRVCIRHDKRSQLAHS